MLPSPSLTKLRVWAGDAEYALLTYTKYVPDLKDLEDLEIPSEIQPYSLEVGSNLTRTSEGSPSIPSPSHHHYSYYLETSRI